MSTNYHTGSDGHPTADYAVGYCRPPVHTRWQKGTSGNPGGRPKRKLTNDLAEAADEALSEIVWIIIRGKRRRMTLAQATAYKAAVDAGGGDARARRDLIQLQRMQRQSKNVPKDEESDEWTIIDAELILEDGDRQAEVTEMNRKYLAEIRRLQGFPEYEEK